MRPWHCASPSGSALQLKSPRWWCNLPCPGVPATPSVYQLQVRLLYMMWEKKGYGSRYQNIHLFIGLFHSQWVDILKYRIWFWCEPCVPRVRDRVHAERWTRFKEDKVVHVVPILEEHRKGNDLVYWACVWSTVSIQHLLTKQIDNMYLDRVTPNVELSSVILLLGFFFQSFQSCVFPLQMLIWMYGE